MVFVAVAIPTFYVGLLIALIPCWDDVPGPYCSSHGGYVIFAGWALGLTLAAICGVASVRRMKRLAATEQSSSSHEA